MSEKRISIAGVSTLLGQSFLTKSLQHTDIIVQSLHDRKVDSVRTNLAAICDWHGSDALLKQASTLPLLPADAPASAPILISFLPDSVGEYLESCHLERGTQVLTHCEYARRRAPLLMPGVKDFDRAHPLLATPNCTTAICAPPLKHIHRAFGISHATITTLQAISGTDLPGMPASAIHDQVIGHLPGEAQALSNELSVLFDDAFPIDAFATRVPVWRGHTITVALALKKRVDTANILAVLADASEIGLRLAVSGRRRFSPDKPLSTVLNVRQTDRGVLLVIEGDNLEAATAGVMLDALLKRP